MRRSDAVPGPKTLSHDQAAPSIETNNEDNFLGSPRMLTPGGELIVREAEEPEAEEEANGWEIVQPLAAESLRPRAQSFSVEEVPEHLIMGCLDPECDTYWVPGEDCQRHKCGGCRMHFCERHVVPWRRPGESCTGDLSGGGSCSSSASPRSAVPAPGSQAAEVLSLLGVPTGAAAELCGDCRAALTPPGGQVSGTLADIAAHAQALMAVPLNTFSSVDENEDPSKSVARALLQRLLDRLHTSLRPWGELERAWVWCLRDALVEKDPSWLAQFAQQARCDSPEDFKGVGKMIEKAHYRRHLSPWDALRVLGSLGRHAFVATEALGERRMGQVVTHATEVAAGLSGGELAFCLEMLLDAADALGAAGAIGGRRAISGMLTRAATGSCPDAALLRGELFWALEAHTAVTPTIAAAGSQAVALPAASVPVAPAEVSGSWACMALEQLLRDQPPEIELGLLRQRSWVHDLERGEFQAACMEPGWGEPRAFPVAVWHSRKRCLGLQGKPHESVSRTLSKNAPLIVRCSCIETGDEGSSSSSATSATNFADDSVSQATPSHRLPCRLLLKRDAGTNLLASAQQMSLKASAQQLSLCQEQRVGQMFRLLERLIWEDPYMKSLRERQGLAPEDVRTTYVIAMTAPNRAMVEFVEGACTLRDVRAGQPTQCGWGFTLTQPERPLFEFLRAKNPNKDDEIKAKKRLAFTAAISAVLSFIAGLGDRHHENFMITDKGRLLHVDYGYALGREPLDSVLLHRLSRTQRPVTTLHFEELADALPESDIRNIFWPVVRGAYLCIRQHGGLMLEMVYAALAGNDPQRNPRTNPSIARATWREAHEFVAGRFVTALPEPKADRFIHALLWHCSRPGVQYGTQLRDDLKVFRDGGLRDKTHKAVATAYEGVKAGGTKAASAMGGILEASSSAKSYFTSFMQAAAQCVDEGAKARGAALLDRDVAQST